ncbi:MAG: hypothetical protein ACR2MY_10070 [Candidatus Dormibacteria bacterium]
MQRANQTPGPVLAGVGVDWAIMLDFGQPILVSPGVYGSLLHDDVTNASMADIQSAAAAGKLSRVVD